VQRHRGIFASYRRQSSDDAPGTRFMPLDSAAVPTIDEWRGKSNEEVGSLVQLAASWK
jgi:hypothetical protein